MTITKKICDSCGAEVEWLYTMPTIRIEGLNLTMDTENGRELCRECAKKLIKKYDTEKFEIDSQGGNE